MSDYILNELLTTKKMQVFYDGDYFEKDCNSTYKELYLKAKEKMLIKDYKESKDILEKLLIENKESVIFDINIYIDLGLILQYEDNLIEAFLNYCRALELSLLQNNVTLISRCFINISEILIHLNYKDEALYIYNQLTLQNISNDKLYYIIAIGNMSYLNYYFNNTELGNYYSKLFFDIVSINKLNNIAFNLLGNYILGERYISVGCHDKGIYYLNKNLELLERENRASEKVFTYLEKAKLYKKLNNKQASKEFLNKAFDISREYKNIMQKVQVLQTMILYGFEEDIENEIIIEVLLEKEKIEFKQKKKLMRANIRSIKEKLDLYNEKQKEDLKKRSLEILKNSLEDINAKDILTNAFNRKYLDNFLNKDYFLTKEMCTFIMIDIDNFKLVNDILGHLYGDETLVQFSTQFELVVGEFGKVFRYGGDEFLIIYEHDTLEDGISITKEIRRCITDIDVFKDIKRYRITLSLGAVTINPKDKKIHNSLGILNRCDKLMYFGKKDGKNQVRYEVIS
ncbi:GGDEF domain-containing protein [Clostridium chrysemydis]|uniref:GGDEF domain-containing protein n=1 Tax=Clostridium chrysemydis TaxID=2665504 RepID=UPI0018840351|nr:GGDEF domain-containing protein [Clostridium chrysemydis]